MRAGAILGGLHAHVPLVLAAVAHGGTRPGRAVAMAAAGAVVGVLVGLTGAGGGALLTPVLVLVFGLPGLAAVGTDLVTSLLVKPVGGAVHLRRHTARLDVAGWLAVGSVPAAAGGVILARAVSTPAVPWLRPAIGMVLLLSAGASLWRHRVRRSAARAGSGSGSGSGSGERTSARPVPTVLLGAVGGLLVGLTSVGSGSIMLAGLVLLYPGLSPSELVGTDLVQAVPLVAAAALAHLTAGDVDIPAAAALLAGALPGVYLGARASSSGRSRMVRPVITVLMVATGLLMVS